MLTQTEKEKIDEFLNIEWDGTTEDGKTRKKKVVAWIALFRGLFGFNVYECQLYSRLHFTLVGMVGMCEDHIEATIYIEKIVTDVLRRKFHLQTEPEPDPEFKPDVEPDSEPEDKDNFNPEDN